jgi:putative transposase
VRSAITRRCAFFKRVVDRHAGPEKITIDKSGSNTVAITSLQTDNGLPIEMRQSKYLNNIVEQDHRAIKRITWLMLGFKSFRCARILIAGIETMHMIRKGQLGNNKDKDSSATSQYYSLAF